MGLHIKILIKSIIDQQVQQVEILKQIKNLDLVQTMVSG